MSDYVFSLEPVTVDETTSSHLLLGGVEDPASRLRSYADYTNYKDSVEVYSDVNNINPSKATTKLYDLNAIYQSIYNILNTSKGEREFLPEFGSSLQDLLFELMDEETSYTVYSWVVSAVSLWEPRVKVRTDLTSVTPDYDNHRYDIKIAFEIVGLEDEVFGLQKYMDVGRM